MNLNGINAEEKIFAKVAGLGLFVEPRVGGAEQPHIHAPRLRGSHTLQFASLQHAQQLGLLAQRDVGDLIEKKRASVGQLEAPDAVGARVGECALNVAEDFALEGTFGQSARVDRNQRHARRAARRRGAAAPRFPCRCHARR